MTDVRRRFGRPGRPTILIRQGIKFLETYGVPSYIFP